MALQFFPHSTTNPSKPRQPPATSTTTGQANTIAEWANDQNGPIDIPYGAVHRKLTFASKGERDYDFKG